MSNKRLHGRHRYKLRVLVKADCNHVVLHAEKDDMLVGISWLELDLQTLRFQAHVALADSPGRVCMLLLEARQSAVMCQSRHFTLFTPCIPLHEVIDA